MHDGGVIVVDQVEHSMIDEVAGELRPHFDEHGKKFHNDFNG